MKQLTLPLTLIALSLACATAELRADEIRAVLRVYDEDRRELECEYLARRELLTREFHRERDTLLAIRDGLRQLECHETRALRIRAVDRQLAKLSRAWARNNQQLSEAHQAQLRLQREALVLAMRDVRRPHPQHLAFSHVPVHRHAANCTCSACGPVVAATARGNRHPNDTPKFDWQSLVLALLNRRLGQ